MSNPSCSGNGNDADAADDYETRAEDSESSRETSDDGNDYQKPSMSSEYPEEEREAEAATCVVNTLPQVNSDSDASTEQQRLQGTVDVQADHDVEATHQLSADVDPAILRLTERLQALDVSGPNHTAATRPTRAPIVRGRAPSGSVLTFRDFTNEAVPAPSGAPTSYANAARSRFGPVAGSSSIPAPCGAPTSYANAARSYFGPVAGSSSIPPRRSLTSAVGSGSVPLSGSDAGFVPTTASGTSYVPSIGSGSSAGGRHFGFTTKEATPVVRGFESDSGIGPSLSTASEASGTRRESPEGSIHSCPGTSANQQAQMPGPSKFDLDPGKRDSARSQIYIRGTYKPEASAAPTPGKRGEKKLKPWEAVEFAARPGVCGVGKAIKVISNHYSIKYNDDEGITFFLYDIGVTRKHRSRGWEKLMKKSEMSPVFWEAVDQHPRVFGVTEPPPYRYTHLVYNDNNMLYCRKNLHLPNGELTIPVNFRDIKGKLKEMKMTIKMTEMKRAWHRSSLVQEQNAALALLDLILTQRIRCRLLPDSENFVIHGRNVFYMDPDVNWNEFRAEHNGNPSRFCVNLSQGVCAWAGFHGAMKFNLQADRILYNVDICHSAFYKSRQNLVYYYYEICDRIRNVEFDVEKMRDMAMDRSQREYAAEKLKGVHVTPSYREGRVYQFCGFENRPATGKFLMVPTENGRRKMSVAEYFVHQYNIVLQMPYLPLVKIKKRPEQCVPMELLLVHPTPTRFKGQPPDEIIAYLLRDSDQGPVERKELIETLTGTDTAEGPNSAFSNEDPYLKDWGVEIDRRMQEINAKILPRPLLQFDNADDVVDAPEGVWSIVVGDEPRKVLKPPQRVAFCLVFVNSASDHQHDPSQYRCLVDYLNLFGVPVAFSGSTPYAPIGVLNWFTEMESAEEALKEQMDQFRGICSLQADVKPMAFFIFERRNPLIYSTSKLICEKECGIYHQGILLKTYKKMSGNPLTNTVARNMFLKINAKLGGTHYRLEPDGLHRNWSKCVNPKEPTLFVGVDVTHPSVDTMWQEERDTGAEFVSSCASVVANIDIDAMQYRASSRVQEAGEERLVNLVEEMVRRISDFVCNTNKRPAHIVVYRDGVAECDMKRTLYEEKFSIEQACTRLDDHYKPTITYIVVSKRHHTRFFPTREKDTSGMLGNLRPGVLVEDTVCTRNYFDFYLLSQPGSVSTSRPTHYYVLHDDWMPSPSFWQTVTYALCFMCCRCPQSISLPAPVHYAHLAAKRAASWLKAYDRLYADDLAQEQEIVRNRLRTEAVNCKLDGMLFC